MALAAGDGRLGGGIIYAAPVFSHDFTAVYLNSVKSARPARPWRQGTRSGLGDPFGGCKRRRWDKKGACGARTGMVASDGAD